MWQVVSARSVHIAIGVLGLCLGLGTLCRGQGVSKALEVTTWTN